MLRSRPFVSTPATRRRQVTRTRTVRVRPHFNGVLCGNRRGTALLGLGVDQSDLGQRDGGFDGLDAASATLLALARGAS